MGIFLIWVIGVVCFGAYAFYCYGRTRERYTFEEMIVPIIFGILFWPIVLPLIVPGFILFKVGKFFYELGEKHREEK